MGVKVGMNISPILIGIVIIVVAVRSGCGGRMVLPVGIIVATSNTIVVGGGCGGGEGEVVQCLGGIVAFKSCSTQ
jgi:hypothetical protein